MGTSCCPVARVYPEYHCKGPGLGKLFDSDPGYFILELLGMGLRPPFCTARSTYRTALQFAHG